MAFNFLNRICSQQANVDLDEIGTSVDPEEGNDLDNESDIDFDEQNAGVNEDLDLDDDDGSDEQNIDLESQVDNRDDFAWSTTLNDVLIEPFTSRIGPKLENTELDYTSEPIEFF